MSGKKPKIGLVLEGGGMKCAYGAGILDCFQEAGIEFDYCIGVSAGSGNGMSFLARQHGRNLRFYTEHTSYPRYFGLKPLIEEGGIFGIEFIYNELSKSTGKDPLDYETFAANPCDFEVVATDAETGKAVYFQKSDIQKDDYRVIMCSACLPAVTKPVHFRGRYYFDGGVADSIPCDRAFEKGCDKIVVITSKPRDFVKEPESFKAAYTRVLKDWPETVKAVDNRHLSYRECQRKMFGYEARGTAFLYCMSRPIKSSTYNINKNTALEMYELGRRDYVQTLPQLRKFLEG
jgi:predicted patatin/cPLA2 family phospholipase